MVKLREIVVSVGTVDGFDNAVGDKFGWQNYLLHQNMT